MKDIEQAKIPQNGRLLTVSEVAERLQVPVSWVYRHAEQLGALRLGKYRRFLWDRVLERLETGRSAGGSVGVATQRPRLTETKGGR